MSQTFTVTTVPLPVYPGGFQTDAVLIYNTGPGTVYASSNPSVTSLTGWPILAGSTISYPASALYLVSESTSAVYVGDDAISVSASPSDIATALINQGLSQQIAQDIYGQGVRNVDAQELITEWTGPMPSGVTHPFGPGNVDLTVFKSLRIVMTINTQTTPPASDIQTLMIKFYADSAYTQLVGTSFTLECQGGCIVNGVIPILGEYAVIEAYTNTSSQADYTGANFYIYGSLSQVIAPSFIVHNELWDSNLAAPVDGSPEQKMINTLVTVPGNSSVTLYPSYYTGPFFMSWLIETGEASNTTGSAVFLTTCTGVDTVIAGSNGDTTTTTALHQYSNLSLGYRQPVVKVYNKNSASLTYGIAICYY